MVFLKDLFVIACFCGVTVLAKNVHVRSVDEKSCENVRQFLSLKNITVGTDITKGSICGGQCCDDKTESLLRKQGQRDFAVLLRHNSKSMQAQLKSTADKFQDHVMELTRYSENKTLVLFSSVYRDMTVLSRRPIEQLYRHIRNYIQLNMSEPVQPHSNSNPEQIANSVTNFFTELFPLAYHHLAEIADKDFTQSYKECLKKSMDTISPFGDTPKQLAKALSKSLEATRMLLEAFKIGTEVLNTTDSILMDENSKGNTQCHDALLKMTYCPKCQGLWKKEPKPCSGYCLNVLRGCLTKYVAELDLPWNGYVEGIESLLNAMKKPDNEAGVNVDFVIKHLENDISTAIMAYMSDAKEIDARVKRVCGPADFSSPAAAALTAPTPPPSTSAPSKQRGGPPPPSLPDIKDFIASIRGFYANLATSLCKDETFAEQKDTKCWNGERIAEYTKTVADMGLDYQKYNPEVKVTVQGVDPRVADLADKLRRVHHMAVNSLGPNYPDVDYMQRDGTEGSGSGAGPDFDEEERDDEEGLRGSGSGDGPGHDDDSDTRNYKPTSNDNVPNPYDQPPSVHVTTGAGDVTAPLSSVITLSISAAILAVTWTRRFY